MHNSPNFNFSKDFSMTTTIHLHSSHIHEGTKIQVIRRCPETGAESVLMDDVPVDQTHTDYVWDGADILIREVKKDADQAA